MGRVRMAIAMAFPFALACSPAPLKGQGAADVQTAYAARTADNTDSTTKSRNRRAIGRIISGTGVAAVSAVAGSYLGAAMRVCVTGDTADVCEFDYLLVGMAGAVLGSALGATWIASPRPHRCTWGGRFGRAVLGSALGAGVSLAAAGMGAHLRRGAGVVATTTVAVLAPATGAAMALSFCD
jgi:hypothetical protein